MIAEIKPVFVEEIPDTLEEGSLYISKMYKVAIHLCCCGCKNQVVTPFYNDGKCWGYAETNEGFSIIGSIGNNNLPCYSHYNITNNKVINLK